MVSARSLVCLPDPRLHIPSSPVLRFDAALHNLAHEMHRAMVDLGGVGLAGVQVGVPLRVFTVGGGGLLDTFVNPTLLAIEGSHRPGEGCLSIPGLWATPPRPEAVEVAWCDLGGTPRSGRFTGLAAQIIAHEMDHLDGKLLVDHFAET